MIKTNLQNEKIKNKYYNFLREAEGFSEKTVDAVKKSIYRYEEFSDFEDFSKFNQTKAVQFKEWVEKKRGARTGKQISITTAYHYLRHLQEFFQWLSQQPGYKSKIDLPDISYLKLPKEKARIATNQKRERYPTFEQVKHVINSIDINNEIDLRDRALLSFTLLSGMRDNAIISLPLSAFDENTLQVNQDPKMGVRTKFSKTIYSALFRFDDELLEYVLEWVKHLKQEKLFGNSAPLFPRNKVEIKEDIKIFISETVEPEFWQSAGSIREIFKKRFRNAGIEYFSPHCFRHLAAALAISRCRNGEEVKAVSQNFGHENVGTIMQTYGTLSHSKVNDVIASMDFTNSESVDNKKILAKLAEILKSNQDSNF